MRDYIFRGKRLDNGEWIEGYLIRAQHYLTDTGVSAIVGFDAMFYPMNEITDCEYVDHKTVGQSTGKLDKHGIKIFEGDIVKAMMDYGPAGLLKTITCIHWDDDGGWQWEYFEMDTVEVIGNIHDDPDVQFGLVED